MTAVKAATRMGVSRQQIWNIENAIQGPPSITTLERYAKAVGAKVHVKRLPSLPR
jgi:transcriptional regulator with XRE-family HTH domain